MITSTRSHFYLNPVRKGDRSRMNVPFKLRDESLDEAFLKGAKERGMVQLKGHRAVGGMRASIYNAMPIEGVQALVACMKEFEQAHGMSMRQVQRPHAEPDLQPRPASPARHALRGRQGGRAARRDSACARSTCTTWRFRRA